MPHPGLGEGGKFHDKDAEHPLPEGEPVTFALVGNQNCGKTTLFNQLTGANQHVGNFPGVTVDRKDGRIRGHAEAAVTDLPGIYSLSPYSSEEVVTRQFLLDEHPRGIINIVDATNVERNLYLTMQLLELGVPMVVALNMMDEVEGNGGTIRVNEMEQLLGVPVVPISASKNEGIGELVDHALHVARYQEPPVCQDFCAADAHGGAVHRCLHGIMALVGDHAERAGIPVRFAASKLAEGDALVLEKLALDENEKHMLGHIVRQLEDERGLDRAAAIADMRFAFIGKRVRRVRGAPARRAASMRAAWRSTAAHRHVHGHPRVRGHHGARVLAHVQRGGRVAVGDAGRRHRLAHRRGGERARGGAGERGAAVARHRRRVQRRGQRGGIFAHYRHAVLLPVASGGLGLHGARCVRHGQAAAQDRSVRALHRAHARGLRLHGARGHGGAHAAVGARPQDDHHAHAVHELLGEAAHLRVLHGGVLPGLRGRGHGGAVLRRHGGGRAGGAAPAPSLFSGEAVPFVMELPNYRMPSARNVGQLLWEKAKDFLERAFTIIFMATIVIWFLQTFDFGLNVVADSADSMLAVAAGWIAPVFAPLGFDDWRISTALVTGVMAKESVVSTLSVLFGSTASLVAALTPLAALGLLVFCLLYTPCVAAIASVRRELGGRWALAMVFGQFAVAWLAALAVRGAGLAMELPAGEAWSVAVGAAVAVAVALVLRRMARRRRAGAGGCGGGCAGGCAGCSATTCAGCAQEGESRPKPPDAETLAESRR